MWGRQLIISSVFSMVFMLTSVLCATATPPVFYGVFVGYKWNTLTVMDRQGHKETYNVTKETLIASNDGTNKRLERLKAGTRLSVTAQHGRATQIVIKEVPK